MIREFMASTSVLPMERAERASDTSICSLTLHQPEFAKDIVHWILSISVGCPLPTSLLMAAGR